MEVDVVPTFENYEAAQLKIKIDNNELILSDEEQESDIDEEMDAITKTYTSDQIKKTDDHLASFSLKEFNRLCRNFKEHKESPQKAYLVKSAELYTVPQPILVSHLWGVEPEVSERSERAFWKTRILAMKCAKWLQTYWLQPLLS